MKIKHNQYKIYSASKTACSTAIACIGFMATLYGLSEQFKKVIDNYTIYAIVAIAMIVIAAFLLVLFDLIPKKQEKEPEPDPISDVRLRFAVERDANSIHEIALNAFRNENLLFSLSDLKSFISLKIFRIAEVRYVNRNDFIIAGYHAVFPLQMATYKMLKDHVLSENNLKKDYIVSASDATCEALYILDIAKDPKYPIASMLHRDLIRYVGKLCRENSNIKVVGTWAFNDHGVRMAEMYQMQKIKEYNDYRNTFFYEAKTSNIDTMDQVRKCLSKEFREDRLITL